ncbi:MAG: DUF134 domain-containing protein [Spirochaetaceae bacterium]|nr:DUF134 domain-containing protein [Spirochaetaceae bacterium]
MNTLMGRQEKCRIVKAPPQNFNFQAVDKLISTEDVVNIRFDEFEALRLSDKLDYDHIAASKIMGISRPTFTRLLNKARQKMATFLIDGRPLQISGGAILFSQNVYCCRNCRRPFVWEQEDDPTCPSCRESNSIKADAACRGNCRCCDENQ